MIIFWVSLFIHCAQPTQEFDNALVFFTAADMRYYIEDVNSSAGHFMGGLAAIKKADYSPSTFIKYYVGKIKVKSEYYRDDERGGEYFLRKSLILN